MARVKEAFAEIASEIEMQRDPELKKSWVLNPLSKIFTLTIWLSEQYCENTRKKNLIEATIKHIKSDYNR